jgi:hypothetical protein
VVNQKKLERLMQIIERFASESIADVPHEQEVISELKQLFEELKEEQQRERKPDSQ